MTALLTALGSGFSAKELLKFLMKKSPELAPKINSALAAGLSAEKVLGFFSKGQNFEKLRSQMEEAYPMENNANPLVQAQNIRSQNLGSDVASQFQRAAPKALGTAAALGTGLALQHALPNLLKGSIPEKIEKTAETPLVTPPITNAPTSIPQPTAPIQPKGIPNPEEYLKEKGVLDKVQEELKKGNTPEAIAALLGIKDTSGRLKAQIDPELVNAIDAYAKQKPAEKVSPIQTTEKSKDIIEPEAPKIEKKSTVLTPQGIGEVREIRNGKAIVEVNGKKFQLNENELEKPEFSNDEIADAYDDLMKKIPESQRSGFISWAGYDEDRNVLGFIPRESGKYEELHNITPEEAQMIKEGTGTARTTGANREGIWAIGEDTRGGIISQIIHDRKRRKKEQEELQLTLFELPKKEKEDKGMKLQFGELEYARGLSREREKKQKLAERAEKKRLKEEEKRKENEAKKKRKK